MATVNVHLIGTEFVLVVALRYEQQREREIVKTAGFRYQPDTRTWEIKGAPAKIAPALRAVLAAGIEPDALADRRAAIIDALRAGGAGEVADALAEAFRQRAERIVFGRHDTARSGQAGRTRRPVASEPAQSGPRRRSALFGGYCAVTGRRFAEGTRIVETPAGWAIDDAETRRVEEIQRSAPIRVSRGEGYGGRLYQPGEVVRLRWRDSQGQEQSGVVVVLACVAKYYREDGMSFGVGDEQGYVYTTYARPATDEEAAPLLEREAQARARREALRRLAQLDATAREQGEWPSPPATRPEGRLVCVQDRRLMIYGGGSYWVLPDSETGAVYRVIGNGADGDNWARNNVPGAILLRVADPDGSLRQELERLDALVGEREEAR